MKKYERLRKRYHQLIDKVDFKNNKIVNRNAAIESDSILNFFECEGYKTYETIFNFIKTNNFTRVFDIGCAYGHQSEIFLNSDINYIGIEEYKNNMYWNEDKYEYITKKYPFKIETLPGDIAISVLCLTWECFLYNGKDTLKEQLNALKRDFKHIILYLAEDKINIVSKYYKNNEHIGRNLYYFYN